VDIAGIQLIRDTENAQWTIHLVVCVEDEIELELVIKRLNRLIDVVKVIDLGSESHHRRSLFVRLRPVPSDVIHVGEIARQFAAEVLELTPTAAMLHLSASPERCDHFVSMLQPYTVIEVIRGAVSGTPTSAKGTGSSWKSCLSVENADLAPPVRLAPERRRA
jgi:acetolactate synthase-1/3 small subunit